VRIQGILLLKVGPQYALRPVGLLVLLLCFHCLHTKGSAQEKSKEFWPEVDVYVPVNEKVRLFFLFTITKSEETKQNTEGQFGAHIDYTVSKRLILRAGYRYGFSLTEEDPYEEHRPILEQSIRQHLPLKTLLTDRNREEFRFVNGKFSFRYRNRVTLEREFRLRRRSITPYGQLEAYHDSRFDVWNRNRLTAGVQIQLRKGLPLITRLVPRRELVLDVYYTKQNDSRSEPHHIGALGVAFQIHL